MDALQIDARTAVLSPDMIAAFDRHDAECARRSREAMDRVLDGFRGRAVLSVTRQIKLRARALRVRPDLLGTIAGLSAGASTGQIIATCDALLERPYARHTGFGGEVPTVNLLAAKLYARWLRRLAGSAARIVSEAA